MQTFRTPEERFAKLEGYPFAPNYHEFEGVRMHYLDEGPRDGPVILMAHGMPTWSYLYRRMIPPLVAAGYRFLANHGQDAHQEVPHFHVHVFGGKDLGRMIKPVDK